VLGLCPAFGTPVWELHPDGVVRDGKSRGEFARWSAGTGATFVTVVEIREESKALADDFDFYVGIDLASAKHQVCVVNRTGKVVGELAFEHSGPGLTAFTRWLDKLNGGATVGHVAIAAEMPRGLIVESIMERGYSVFSINPKQLDRFRDRHTVAGAKDDRRDAFVLADSLRTDQPLFRRLARESVDIIRLRELSRLEDDLIQDHGRLINQLREQLHR
jgi:transposase